MRSVFWLASNVDTGRATHALNKISQQENLSANLCDGLLDMQPDDDQATLSVGAEWEWRYGAARGCENIGMVRLHREHFAFVAEVSRRLRPKQEDQKSHLHVDYTILRKVYYIKVRILTENHLQNHLQYYKPGNKIIA